MRNIRAILIVLCLMALTIDCASATENQKILMLVHNATSLDTEIINVKPSLENWGYTVDVFDYTEDYKLIHDNVGGDHWFLNYTTGAHGHGNLDLVTNGTMNYKVIIFGPKSATSYGDVENASKPVIKSMFEAYPFIGFVRMESGYSSQNSTNNLFQVGTSGSVSAKNIKTSNPANIWALEPLKGYTKTFSVTSEKNISATTSNVTVLERFNDSTPAITKVEYPSGAKAFYFAFKDWGYPTHVSMLVRLIQQYSGMPYRVPYYSYELDDGGDPIAPNADYLNLVNFTKTNLGGYPTISLMGSYIDNNSPPYIRAFGQSPSIFTNNTNYNSNTPDLIASLKRIPDYAIAAHGYQHDRDLWEWTVNSTYVDGFATNASGVPNWQNDYIEYPVANKNNPNLTLFSGAEFADPNATFVENHISRMRAVFDSYGLENYRVVITPKFIHLNYTDAIFSKYGFNVISGLATNDGYIMAMGYNDRVYVPIRVSPSHTGDYADTALDSTSLYNFKLNFWKYIGTKPYALVTSHLLHMREGNTTGYELRDSRLPGYLVLNSAGYKLMSSQAVANKNIGWLWTTMNSTADSSGNISLNLNSTNFADGADIHELNIIMPSNISQATLNGKYLINIDNSTLSIGKESGTNITVEIINGTYNTSLPRISSVSTPATDILKSEYDATTGKISLGLNGTFATDIGINNYNRPFSNGTTTIYSKGSEILNVTPIVVGGFITDSTDSLNATIIPSVDAVNITVSMWNTSGDYRKIWNESSETHNVVTSHVIGSFPATARIQLNVDGVKQAEFTSNSSGQIEFAYTGYSEHTFEAFLEDEQGQKLIANFSANITEGFAPLSVQFNDSSENATGVSWDFNGDGITDSEDRNPVYEFTIPGNYTVNLTASNENGTDSTSAEINVTEKPEPVLPVANFTSNTTEGYAPLSVQFNDLSENADSVAWDFNGDGIY